MFLMATTITFLTALNSSDTTAAVGNIKLASVQFGNFSIPRQAFSELCGRLVEIHSLNPHIVDASGSNATSDNDKGVLGLGP